MKHENLNADYKFVLQEKIEVWKIKNPLESISLSACEAEHAQRILSNESREGYVSGRSAIRLLAAKYTGECPSFFAIKVSPLGKPYFENEPDLHFSLSHCRGEVGVAFSASPVGFDMEKKARSVNGNALAKRFFSPSEALQIAQAGREGDRLFLEFWTAKEAMLKLAGTGLAGGLDRAEVRGESEGWLDEQRIYLHRLDWTTYQANVATFNPSLTIRERGLFVG